MSATQCNSSGDEVVISAAFEVMLAKSAAEWWQRNLSNIITAQVVLCKIAAAQFRNMFEVGQATYAHYAQEGLPQNPAGFPSASQDRCIPTRGTLLGITQFLMHSTYMHMDVLLGWRAMLHELRELPQLW